MLKYAVVGIALIYLTISTSISDRPSKITVNVHLVLSRKDKNSLSLELVNQSLLTFYPFPAIIQNYRATTWI